MSTVNLKHCLICGKANRTVYLNIDKKKRAWCYCCACGKSWKAEEYCALAHINYKEFLENADFKIATEDKNEEEIRPIAWQATFTNLNSPRAEEGLDYLKKRGLKPIGPLFYDIEYQGIVFPYYYKGIFAGAQIRLIKPWIDPRGKEYKVITIPNTKTGLLVYNYDQTPLPRQYKAVVVCEGAFNALSIEQSLNEMYGSPLNNPFKIVAFSGSGFSSHQLDICKELKNKGYQIILASDYDEAGSKMLFKGINKNVLTHYAVTGEKGKDWNDILIAEGAAYLAKFFLSKVTPTQASVNKILIKSRM